MVGKKKKKSKAQINRLLKRAEARGETYNQIVVVVRPKTAAGDDESNNEDDRSPNDLQKGSATASPQQEEQVRGDDDDDHDHIVPPLVASSADNRDHQQSTKKKSGESSNSTAIKNKSTSSSSSSINSDDDKDNVIKKKLEIALELKASLESIAKAGEGTLKAKERRSAKRKAEAIAAEKSGGCTAEELLAWLEQQPHDEQATRRSSTAKTETTQNKKKAVQQKQQEGDVGDAKKKKNPYIVFVGQLSYETTKESLLQHIQKELEKEVDESGNCFDISADTVSIRLLTDAKNPKKSRGMAFVQVQDPQLLYALLKLHLTHLQGRRLNVERSAGGKSTSTSRQLKIQELRQEQVSHMQSVVATMLQEHYDNATIRPGELDDGVIALCQRHAATVVQAALERYCESHGRDMDNPSAYLTFLLGKLAEEGIFERNEHDNHSTSMSKKRREVIAGGASPRFSKKPKTNKHESSLSLSSSAPRGGSGFNKKNTSHHHDNSRRPNGPSAEQQKYGAQKNDKPSSSSSSIFAKQGVDMSISDSDNHTGQQQQQQHQKDLSSIFPSISSRGGRGKG